MITTENYYKIQTYKKGEAIQLCWTPVKEYILKDNAVILKNNDGTTASIGFDIIDTVEIIPCVIIQNQKN